ncbi:hypothetical protein E4U38_007749 [Claviceps purpurea]|nr:hypothetical protein E4U38_007749 [Claviceps purpurea]
MSLRQNGLKQIFVFHDFASRRVRSDEPMWAVSGDSVSRDTESHFARRGPPVSGDSVSRDRESNFAQPQPVQRQEGVWYSRSHISTYQLAPNPLAELPTTTNLRRARSEAAAGEHRSAVLGINLKEHKAKATKEAQDRRNRNAQASKRSRLKKSAKEKAEATKREQEMKQELDDTKSELQQSRQEIERLRGVDAENEKLKRQVEELQQKK